MKTKYLEIGDDDWRLLFCWDYDTYDTEEIWGILKAFNISDRKTEEALDVLSEPNTGLTVTDFSKRMSAVFISKAVSTDQWIDTLFHELKHVVEHISTFYEVSPQSEPAAYLQGEIGKQLFPVIMGKLCRKRSYSL